MLEYTLGMYNGTAHLKQAFSSVSLFAQNVFGKFL